MCDISNSCLVKDNKDRMSQCPEQALPHCPTWVFPSLLHCKIILFTCKMDFFFLECSKSLKKTSLGLISKTSIPPPFFCFHRIPFLSILSKMFLLLFLYPFNICSPEEQGSITLVSTGFFS